MNKSPASSAGPYASNTIYAGVDVSKDHVDVCCFDAEVIADYATG